MLDKIKNHPLVSIIIVCSIVIPMTVAITVWFYQRQMENIISKCEADKATMKNNYEMTIKKIELKVEQLKLKRSKNSTILPHEINQNTHGNKSPAIVSNGDVNIQFDDE